MSDEDKKLIQITENESPDEGSWVYTVNPAGDIDQRVSLSNLIQGGKGIISNPSSGEYRITNIRLDADKKIVITYDETPEA